MWREKSYSFQGKYFSMPPRNVLPKPYSDPHPPMWVACGSPATFKKAGELGLGAFCFTTGSPKTLEPLIKSYKDAVANATPVGDYVNDNILCVTSFVCEEDREAAFDLACNIHLRYYETLVFHWLDNIMRPPHVPEWPEILPERTTDELRVHADKGISAIGDPNDVARACQAYQDLGCDQLVFSPLSTTMGYDAAIRSTELFAKEVLPQFDKDPVHRTTRMRQAAATKVS
jgi:alkanesulfonate monooxygenase SsuD/methylene tetrahydromethanopterin reductase-like flavin-dependent oxidoreductase (luciferase family)